jgi:hypothetical protein
MKAGKRVLCRKMSNFLKIGSVPWYFTNKRIWTSTITIHLSWRIWIKFGTISTKCRWVITSYCENPCSESHVSLMGSVNYCSCCLHFYSMWKFDTGDVYRHLLNLLCVSWKPARLKPIFLGVVNEFLSAPSTFILRFGWNSLCCAHVMMLIVHEFRGNWLWKGHNFLMEVLETL